MENNISGKSVSKFLKVSKFALFCSVASLVLPFSLNRENLYNNNLVIQCDIDNDFSIDDLGNMVLQGVCVVRNNIFLTAYDSSNVGENSIIYILDENNNCIKEVTLYNNSHVGGICYDDKNNIFWITDKGGTVSGYTYDSIFYNKGEICYPKFQKIDVGSEDLINYKGKASASYITYDDGKIYVGNYTFLKNSFLKSFCIDEDGNIDLDSCKKVGFVDKVQGISFYERDNCKYLLVSTSCGINNASELKIFKYDEDCKDFGKENYVKEFMPPMMEQITFNKDGNLVTLYESNAKKYKKNYSVRSNDVVVFEFDFKEKVLVKKY